MKIIPVWQDVVSISCFSKTFARVWRISRILARGTRSSGSLLLPPPFAFYDGYDLYVCLDFRDSALQIKMFYHLEGVFEVDESNRSIYISLSQTSRCIWHQVALPKTILCIKGLYCVIDLPSLYLLALLEEPDITEKVEKIISFAPGEGNLPLGIFMDKESEFLSFPTI